MDKQGLGAGMNQADEPGAAWLLIRCQHLSDSRVAGAEQWGIREKTMSVVSIWGEQASFSSSDTFLGKTKLDGQ